MVFKGQRVSEVPKVSRAPKLGGIRANFSHNLLGQKVLFFQDFKGSGSENSTRASGFSRVSIFKGFKG